MQSKNCNNVLCDAYFKHHNHCSEGSQKFHCGLLGRVVTSHIHLEVPNLLLSQASGCFSVSNFYRKFLYVYCISVSL